MDMYNELRRKYVTVDDIQKEYLPISKKKIRSLIKKYLPTKMIGGRLFTARDQLEHLLSDADCNYLPLD